MTVEEKRPKTTMSEFQEDMFSEMEVKRPKEQLKETRFKGKHSLDSDEEDDDGDKYELLDDEDIEGSHNIHQHAVKSFV